MRFYFFCSLIAGLLSIVLTSGTHAREHQAPGRGFFEASFDDVDNPQSRISLGITHKADPKTVSRYFEDKSQKGTYLRTQFDVLICEEAPCEQKWTAAFMYTDKTGKSDSIGLTWKQTVFTGMTPSGTVKREFSFCVNQQCMTFNDPKDDNAPREPQTRDIGRYRILWSKYSLIIGRSDAGN